MFLDQSPKYTTLISSFTRCDCPLPHHHPLPGDTCFMLGFDTSISKIHNKHINFYQKWPPPCWHQLLHHGIGFVTCSQDITIKWSYNARSPWYSWKIAELALNNIHSLTHYNALLNFCKRNNIVCVCRKMVAKEIFNLLGE